MDWMQVASGTLVGAVVLFVWYGIAWMVLQHHKADYGPVKNNEALTAALSKVEPAEAFYSIPHES